MPEKHVTIFAGLGPTGQPLTGPGASKLRLTLSPKDPRAHQKARPTLLAGAHFWVLRYHQARRSDFQQLADVRAIVEEYINTPQHHARIDYTLPTQFYSPRVQRAASVTVDYGRWNNQNPMVFSTSTIDLLGRNIVCRAYFLRFRPKLPALLVRHAQRLGVQPRYVSAAQKVWMAAWLASYVAGTDQYSDLLLPKRFRQRMPDMADFAKVMGAYQCAQRLAELLKIAPGKPCTRL